MSLRELLMWSLTTAVTECSEAQLVTLVLIVVVVAVALLSYFVVAPEYEKHLNKQYSASVHAASSPLFHDQKERNQLLARMKLRKHKSLDT